MTKFFPTYSLIAAMITFSLLTFLLSKSESFWTVLTNYSSPAENDYLRVYANSKQLGLNDKIKKRVLLLGSSTTREGYDTDLLNSQSKEFEFINFGISGFNQPIEYFELVKWIKNASPDLIVITPQPGTFFAETNETTLKYFFNFETLNESWENLSFRKRNLDIYLNSLASSLSGVIRFWSDSKTVLLRFIFKSLKNEKLRVPILFKNVPLSVYEPNQDEIKLAIVKFFSNNPNPVNSSSTVIEKISSKLLSIAPIYIIDLPLSPAVENNLSQLHKELYQKNLRNFKGSILIARKELPRFEPEDYRDSAHLNALGRQKLSVFLLELFKSSVKGESL